MRINQFGAQALDVRVDRPRVADVIESPEKIKELVTRKDALRVRCEQVEKIDLGSRQHNAIAVDDYHILKGIISRFSIVNRLSASSCTLFTRR